MTEAFICDAVRTPIGRYGGALSGVRADDLAAIPLRALRERNPQVDWTAVDDVVLGCANQAGEDNRNVARMAALLAGLPVEVPASTINRLCGSGMDAVGIAARAIKSGEAELVLAGGVESMSRAPFVLGKAETAFARSAQIHDTTIGWRFVNPQIERLYGIDSMPETADHVAAEFGIGRADQDAFALRSQQRWAAAQAAGRFRDEIVAVAIPQKKGEPRLVSVDEHPRADASLDALARLKGINGPQRLEGGEAGDHRRDQEAVEPVIPGQPYLRAHGAVMAAEAGGVGGLCAGLADRRRDRGHPGRERGGGLVGEAVVVLHQVDPAGGEAVGQRREPGRVQPLGLQRRAGECPAGDAEPGPQPGDALARPAEGRRQRRRDAGVDQGHVRMQGGVAEQHVEQLPGIRADGLRREADGGVGHPAAAVGDVQHLAQDLGQDAWDCDRLGRHLDALFHRDGAGAAEGIRAAQAVGGDQAGHGSGIAGASRPPWR